MKKVVLLLVIAVVCTFCAPQKEKIPPVTTMEESTGKVIIYQVMTRLFGNTTTTNKPYGTIEENGVGKFNDINDAALKGIKDMGVTHVWYTGIIEHAMLTDYSKFGIQRDDADVVKGRAGSPYAIKDYYDVNPDLAVDVKNRMKEFEALVDRTHKQGMKVLIDFVPNHVARVYKSDQKPQGVKDLGEGDNNAIAFSPKNNFYYLPGQSFVVPKHNNPFAKDTLVTSFDGKFTEIPAKVTGNDQFTASPGINEWYETVKLNYGIDIQQGRQKHFDPVPDTWTKMRDILLYWTAKKVDGFRCDMAEMVPVEFWNWAIPQIKIANPDIIFIAEIYNPAAYKSYLETGKFNYLYDKVQLYDTLRLLLKGERSTNDIHDIQESLKGINRHMVHFLENHDEQRIASKYFAGNAWHAVPAMAVSATVDQGAVMIYFGQEVGEPGLGVEGFGGDDGRTTIFDYWGVPEHQKWVNGGKYNGDSLSTDQKQLRQFYVDLLKLAGSNPAITEGDYYDITDSNIKAKNFSKDVLAYIRNKGDERLLILATFNKTEVPIKVQIPSEVATKIGLNANGNYSGIDLLSKNNEFKLSSQLQFELTAKPYSAYIIKLK
ncbi:MAG TPA: alpha-amylase family glycosyl hydrolase [Cyclobacteriaceae bacterium]|jgi:glycosidase|nr:alpha-amylase family glycosyl hydrolase [Cyclobacteriaceae bacterium]